jgi:hypothetical protein
MTRSLHALLIVVAGAGFALAGNWPGWRGPKGNGISPEQAVPLTWSPFDNVRWQTSLPEGGHNLHSHAPTLVVFLGQEISPVGTSL